MAYLKRAIPPLLILGWTAMILWGCGEGGGNPGLTAPGGGGDTTGVTLFSDGFENGADNWTAGVLWGLSTSAHSGFYSLYVWDATNTTGTADINTDFDLTSYSSATLTFWTKSNYGNMGPGGADRRVVVEANDDSIRTLWVEVFQVNEPWTEVSLPLDDFCGWASKFDITFWYTKYDPGVITWWLDDVEIKAQ